MGAFEVKAFLSYLAYERHVCANSQNFHKCIVVCVTPLCSILVEAFKSFCTNEYGLYIRPSLLPID